MCSSCIHEEGMHTFTLKPRLTWVCRHIEPGYYQLINTYTHQSQLYAHIPSFSFSDDSFGVSGRPRLTAAHTTYQARWLLAIHINSSSSRTSPPPPALSVPTTGMPSSSLRWIHGLFWEGMCLLYHKVSSQADWLMTRLIKTPDVLNNGAFVKESTEVLFHQEPVYLPF